MPYSILGELNTRRRRSQKWRRAIRAVHKIQGQLRSSPRRAHADATMLFVWPDLENRPDLFSYGPAWVTPEIPGPAAFDDFWRGLPSVQGTFAGSWNDDD